MIQFGVRGERRVAILVASAIGILSLATCLTIDFLYFPRSVIFPDEGRFLDSARGLVATGEFGVSLGRAWEMPGTALFFAPFVSVFGQTPVWEIRCAQAVLLILQSACVGYIAGRLFCNVQTALLAAAMSAFYPFSLFYQGLLLSEPLFNTMLIGSFAALLLWQKRGCRLDWSLVLACLCFAVATYVKATLMFLPPLLLAITAAATKVGTRRTICVLIVSSVFFAGCLAPWWIRNYAVVGELVPFTTGAGQNLYLGNNSGNKSGGNDWDTDAEPDVVSRIRAMDGETARQRAFVAEALNYIRGEPLTFVRNMAVKFLRFWNVVPNAESYRGVVFQAVSLMSFGPILLLALVCVFAGYPRLSAAIPIYVLIAFFTVAYSVTIASLRYRLPLEPFLIVLAAEPLRRFIEMLRARVASRPT